MNSNELMADEELHIKKLQDLVAKAIEEEELLSYKLIESDLNQNITRRINENY